MSDLPWYTASPMSVCLIKHVVLALIIFHGSLAIQQFDHILQQIGYLAARSKLHFSARSICHAPQARVFLVRCIPRAAQHLRMVEELQQEVQEFDMWQNTAGIINQYKQDHVMAILT